MFFAVYALILTHTLVMFFFFNFNPSFVAHPVRIACQDSSRTLTRRRKLSLKPEKRDMLCFYFASLAQCIKQQGTE